MWVQTSAGDVVNVSAARRIYLESEYDGSGVKVVAAFAPDDVVTLAYVPRAAGASPNEMNSRARAAYRAVVAGLRDGHPFCDLSEA